MACIAAEQRDYEAVGRHLRIAADHGQMMPLSHTLRDVDLEKIRGEPWFRGLRDEIFARD